MKAHIDNEVAAHMRSLVGMVSNLVAMSEKRDVDAQFDASLAKNQLARFFPIGQVGDEVTYLFDQPEVRKALVEMLRAHFRKTIGNNWTRSAIDTEFIAFVFAKDLGSHLYWHASHDKA